MKKYLVLNHAKKDKGIITMSNSTRKNKQITNILYVVGVKIKLFIVNKLVDLDYLIITWTFWITKKNKIRS